MDAQGTKIVVTKKIVRAGEGNFQEKTTEGQKSLDACLPHSL